MPCSKAARPARVLLFSSTRLLLQELAYACRQLGFMYEVLFLGHVRTEAELKQSFVQAVERLQPDFLLTINHLGLDREGFVSHFSRQRKLPCVSWFVDNPALILPAYAEQHNPYLAYAVWDEKRLPWLQRHQVPVMYLPLGVSSWHMRVAYKNRTLVRDAAFVGNSMVRPVASCWEQSGLEHTKLPLWEEIAKAFVPSLDHDMAEFCARNFPEQGQWLTEQKIDVRLNLESFLYWRATQIYRLHCVENFCAQNAHIAGDAGWKELLQARTWQPCGILDYYRELPAFYASTRVNLNSTSLQMKGAVNQRVFDVPAAGAFVLTEYAEQLEGLFIPGKEVICYEDPAEISALTAFYLRQDTARQKIIANARRRLKEHSYAQRLARLWAFVRHIFDC